MRTDLNSRGKSINRCHAITAGVLLLYSYAFAEELKRDDFQTYIATMPRCDRVEVIRIGGSAGELVPVEGKEGTVDLVYPADKSNLYHVEPHDEWSKVLARKTVAGIDAERIAGYLRSFQPRVSEQIEPDGSRSFSFGPNCHQPPFAYRFFAGEKLLYDTSVCWGCGNLIVGPEGKRHCFYFNKETKEAKDLLEASKKLFPEHPLK
jgi:hypothetical protein